MTMCSPLLTISLGAAEWHLSTVHGKLRENWDQLPVEVRRDHPPHVRRERHQSLNAVQRDWKTTCIPWTGILYQLLHLLMTYALARERGEVALVLSLQLCSTNALGATCKARLWLVSFDCCKNYRQMKKLLPTTHTSSDFVQHSFMVWPHNADFILISVYWNPLAVHVSVLISVYCFQYQYNEVKSA